MPLFKHLWVAKELLHMCGIVYNIYFDSKHFHTIFNTIIYSNGCKRLESVTNIFCKDLFSYGKTAVKGLFWPILNWCNIEI